MSVGGNYTIAQVAKLLHAHTHTSAPSHTQKHPDTPHITLKVPAADKHVVAEMGAVEKYTGTWTVEDTPDNRERFAPWLHVPSRPPSRYIDFVKEFMNDSQNKALYPATKDRLKQAASAWRQTTHDKSHDKK